uniref:Uncharacterized protein n=1 Tax=Ditylenchus dipsaci TaxID=166011 RepID=A0A915CN93_9BILA
MDERPDPGRLDDFIPEVERNPSPTDINTASAGLYAWRQRQARKSAAANQSTEEVMAHKEEPQLIPNYDLQPEDVADAQHKGDVSFTNSNSSYFSLPPGANNNSVNASFRTAKSCNGHHKSLSELSSLLSIRVASSSLRTPKPASKLTYSKEDYQEDDSNEDQSVEYILEQHHWPSPLADPITSRQPSLETILETIEESEYPCEPIFSNPTQSAQKLERRLSLTHPLLNNQPSKKKTRSEFSGTPPLASNFDLEHELKAKKEQWMPIEISVDKSADGKGDNGYIVKKVVPIRVERPATTTERIRVPPITVAKASAIRVERNETKISKTSYKFYDKNGREIWPDEGWKHRRSRVAVEEGEEISLTGDTREWRQFLAEQRLPNPGYYGSRNRIDADSRFRIIHPTASNNSNNNNNNKSSSSNQEDNSEPKITRPIIQTLERPLPSNPVAQKNGYSSLDAATRRPRPATYTEPQQSKNVQWVSIPEKHKPDSLIEPTEIYGEKKTGGRSDHSNGPSELKNQ